jgi:ABC-type branched-subunit amino acid transport system substrate-binding protein
VSTLRSGGGWRALAIFAAGVLVGVLSSYQVVPPGRSPLAAQPGEETTGPASSSNGPAGPTPGATTTTGPTGPAGPSGSTGPGQRGGGLECARGRNGGATDRGVTATSIRLATTVVNSGFGAAFLGEMQIAMEAVKNKVNRAGGICGRLLEVRYVDDGWDPARGQRYIKNFIDEGYFAIPVGPSSEGLNAAIRNGVIRSAGIPVVGTDGMVISQYIDPWVWPVAVSTASSARIMARRAKELGAKRFSIVFDSNYKFGREAAEAFNAEVRRLTGSNVPGYDPNLGSCRESFCGIIANQNTYGGEVQRFQPGDIVVMFLEPKTAETWMASGGPTPKSVKDRGGLGVWGAQPLFTYEFEVNCQERCDGMWVWTGFKPPLENYRVDPAVRQFVEDLHATKRDADQYNAFSEGGYVGMQLLVEALRRVGPRLTRAALRQVLDAMDWPSPLTLQPVLRWRPGSHFPAATMQAFEIQYKGSPAFWRARDIASDPDPVQTGRDVEHVR